MELSTSQGFERAYAQHSGGVHAAARRILGDSQAHDVVQDVFMSLWRRPERFDPERGELGAYLRLMARSRALDLWREAQAARRASDRLTALTAPEEGRPDERPALAAERGARRASVRAAVRALPEPQRQALGLAYWGELTAPEIAARSAVPVGTAKSRIRLGLIRLRDDAAGSLGAERGLSEAA